MGIEAVDGVEARGERGALLGQVGLRAAAQDEYVDAIGERVDVVERMNCHIRAEWAQRAGVAAREDADELGVGVLRDGRFHAATEISVAGDADPDSFVHECFLRLLRLR